MLKSFRIHQSNLPSFTANFDVLQVLDQGDKTCVVVCKWDKGYELEYATGSLKSFQNLILL